MRNLKKILALVLALVMSLSLMATAGAASFPDVADDNAYKTAIEVLNGVEVLQGYDNGARFEPKGSITRAEAAAVIYRIATGDVNDTQKDIYTEWNGAGKLSDVSGWYAGYVNYCSNAGYIKGYPDGTFQAQNNVTGYEVLAMVMRALGYGRNGEFSGSQWAITTASLAQTLGITKNVKENLGDPATREMVAEIVFRAIFCETQQYNALHLYEGTGTYLAKENLDLEELTGVVTANEFADLDDVKTLADGKTRLVVDGKAYNLDVKSEMTDIGELRHAYVKGGTQVLTTLEDAGNSVAQPENGKGTEIAKLAKDNNLRLTDDTQYYLNFGDSEHYTCERRLEYSVTFDNTVGNEIEGLTPHEWFTREYGVDVADVVGAGRLDKVTPAGGAAAGKETYTRVIPADDHITVDDLAIIRGIFGVAEDDTTTTDTFKIEGYVHAGTNNDSSNNRNVDLSDEISYRTFVKDYINGAAYNLEESDNGEWLKIVDNNGDGVAEYVFLTEFVMTTITAYNSRTGIYTVEYDATETKTETAVTEIDEDDIVSVDGEALAVNDVILYTLVDGKYYVDHPETAVDTASKIDHKNDTLTGKDDAVYTWSGIDKEADRYYEELSELETKVEYVLYLDHFNYVRLATEPNKGFMLLTDGYYYTNYRTEEVQAQIYDLETNELIDVDVVDKGETAYKGYDTTPADNNDGYIDTFEGRDHGNAGTWDRLNTFGQYRYNGDNAGATEFGHYARSTAGGKVVDPFKTNVAAVKGSNADGYTLYDISAANTSRMEYNSYEIYDTNDKGSGSVSAKDRQLFGITAWTAANRNTSSITRSTLQSIFANDQTRYYLVERDGDDNPVVTTWIGYKNAETDFVVENGYVISHDVVSLSGDKIYDYEVADVVVFEGKKAETVNRAWFGYGWSGDNGATRYYVEDEDILVDESIREMDGNKNIRYTAGWDGEGYSIDVQRKLVDVGNLEFYDKDGQQIDDEFNSYGVYAGFALNNADVNSNDYVSVSRATGDYLYGNFNSDNINQWFNDAQNDEDPNRDSWESFRKAFKSFQWSADVGVYKVVDRTVGSRTEGYSLQECNRIDAKDVVLYMTNPDGDVVLAINVTQSAVTGNGDGFGIRDNLWQLWLKVISDQTDDSYVYVVFADGSTKMTFVANTGDQNGQPVTIKPYKAPSTGSYRIPSSGNVTIPKAQVLNEDKSDIAVYRNDTAANWTVEVDIIGNGTLYEDDTNWYIEGATRNTALTVAVTYTGDPDGVIMETVPYEVGEAGVAIPVAYKDYEAPAALALPETADNDATWAAGQKIVGIIGVKTGYTPVKPVITCGETPITVSDLVEYTDSDNEYAAVTGEGYALYSYTFTLEEGFASIELSATVAEASKPAAAEITIDEDGIDLGEVAEANVMYKICATEAEANTWAAALAKTLTKTDLGEGFTAYSEAGIATEGNAGKYVVLVVLEGTETTSKIVSTAVKAVVAKAEPDPALQPDKLTVAIDAEFTVTATPALAPGYTRKAVVLNKGTAVPELTTDMDTRALAGALGELKGLDGLDLAAEAAGKTVVVVEYNDTTTKLVAAGSAVVPVVVTAKKAQSDVTEVTLEDTPIALDESGNGSFEFVVTTGHTPSSTETKVSFEKKALQTGAEEGKTIWVGTISGVTTPGDIEVKATENAKITTTDTNATLPESVHIEPTGETTFEIEVAVAAYTGDTDAKKGSFTVTIPEGYEIKSVSTTGWSKSNEETTWTVETGANIADSAVPTEAVTVTIVVAPVETEA